MSQLLLCRHRDHRNVEKTPVDHLMQFESETQWYLIHAMSVAIRQALDKRGMSLLQAFHCFDIDGDGVIDAGELWTAMCFLQLAQPTATSESHEEEKKAQDSSVPSTDASSVHLLQSQDIMDFIRLADRNEDGSLDFNEFTHALRTREETMEGQEEHVNEEVGAQDDEDDLTHERKTNIDSSTSALSASSQSSSSASIHLPKLTRLPLPPLPSATPPPTYIAPSKVAPMAQTINSASSSRSAAMPHQPPSSQPQHPPQSAPSQSPPPAGPRSPPLVVSLQSWNCSVCTYLNAPGRSRCEMCDTPNL